LECPPGTWKTFCDGNNTPLRSVKWLLGTPLGENPELWRSVFFRERAVGDHIAKAGDQVGTANSLNPVDSGRENANPRDDEGRNEKGDGGNGGDVGGDVGGEGDSNEAGASVPATRRLSAAQTQRLATNPDHTAPQPEQEDPLAVEAPSTKRRARERDSTILADSIERSIASLAAPQLKGLDAALEKATEEVMELFGEKISEEEMMNCLDYLHDNPRKAMQWRKLPLRWKEKYVEKWKSGDVWAPVGTCMCPQVLCGASPPTLLFSEAASGTASGSSSSSPPSS
jgi:hypothetical protein